MTDALRPRLWPADLPARALAICSVAQLALLLIHNLGSDAAGHPLQVSPVNALMLQAPMYAVGLLVPASLWSAACWLFPRLRRGWNAIGTLVAFLLMFVAVLDLGMQRFRGERIALNHFATYGTGGVMNSDWVRPVLNAAAPTTMTFAVLLVACAMLVLSHRSLASDTGNPRRATATFALLALACWIPPRFAYYHQRDMARPPQAVLLGDVIRRPWRPPSGDESDVRTALRTLLDPDATTQWLSDSFPVFHAAPLATSPGFGVAQQDPPDIVIFSIESLRGRDVGWGFGDRRGADSPTPHLDSLAAQSVTFPRYISNGEPSPRGFITLHAGVWEHGNLFIVANRQAVALDAIPQGLRQAGYHTVALWGGNPSFDNQLTWARRWYDDVFFERRDNRVFYFRTTPDHELMDRAIARIDAHDRDRGRQPLFIYVASNGTHTPFDLEEGAAVPADVPPSTDPQRRYDLTLRNADAQIARVIARLRARARWRNTVVIVTGDHSDRTAETADQRWRGMPTDALVASSALVFGPEALVGRPRVLSFPASHVDLTSTIRAWFGDTTATPTMGRDLFDTSRVASRHAIAINSRGYRLDRGGYTLMVDSKDPRVFGAWRSFTGESPQLVPLNTTPFAANAPGQLHTVIQYWSALVDGNRVRPH